MRTLGTARSLWLAAALAAAAAPGAAQTPDRSSLWSLLELPGQHTQIRYTPGALERATRIQQSYENLTRHFRSWSGEKRISIAVFVISREEWDQVGIGLPYSFPSRLPMSILTLSAWGDEGTVELWERLLGGALPVSGAAPARGSALEMASVRVADLLGEVEGARILLEKAQLAGAERWITELMAHSVAHSVWLRDDPEAAALMRNVSRAWRARPGAPLGLETYQAGVSMEDWLWFQAAFHAGARRLADGAGPKGASRLLKMARKRGGQLRAADLFERYPELRRWHLETFAAR